MSRRALRAALAAMDHATTHDGWLAAAHEHDALSGALAWRADDEDGPFDAARMRRDLDRLAALQREGQVMALAEHVDQTLTRHHGDLALPELHLRAFTGTKHLVARFVDGICGALDWLADTALPPALEAQRLRRFRRAAHSYGRSCLMLSGGGTLGWIHFGVVKALFEQDLLPHVISGASMGAMVAAGVCTRTDAELADLIADPSQVRTFGLVRKGLGLDPDALLDTIRHNVGDWTFGEAAERSGRILNISLSPVRRGQRPRLLCELTAEQVLIPESALASSAVPGLYPPAALWQRGPDGERRPYLQGERWMDGSFHGDLPKRRMARLHQVNHVIVSQTNPHVVPFLSDPRRRSTFRAAARVGGKAMLRQGQALLSGVAQATASTPLSALTETARELATQDYLGDIDLHPQFQPGLVAKAFTNASAEEFEHYILLGERATWPHLARIDVETRIARTFHRCLQRLDPDAHRA